MKGYKIKFKRYDPFGSDKYWIEEATVLKEYKNKVLTDWKHNKYDKNRIVYKNTITDITIL